MSGVMEFMGWVFVWFIIFSLLFTPGGLAILLLIAVTGLLMLPFVIIAQSFAMARELNKED